LVDESLQCIWHRSALEILIREWQKRNEML
jgi:hypothetical protein